MCDAEKDWHQHSFASGAINSYQKSLDEPEMKFFIFIFSHQEGIFKCLFDIFGPQLNTILSVGISLKYFRRKYFRRVK